MDRVERYTMGIGAPIVLGEAKEFRVRDWTACTFKPDRLVANAPCEGFIEIESACVDNIDVLFNDDGSERFETHDAYYFIGGGPAGGGRAIKPYLCEHGVSMRIKYTGLVPEGFKLGQDFTFSLAFTGPTGKDRSK